MIVNLSKTLLRRSNSQGFQRCFSSKAASVESGKYDAIIIGAGHNGLVCSNYLAKQNMKVLVLERRHVVGGAAVSEEVFPGYTFSRASYLLSLFRNVIIEEIFPSNWRQELTLYRRHNPSFTPSSDGRYLLIGGGVQQDLREIGKFSEKDAKNFLPYCQKLEEILKFINPVIDTAPASSIGEVLKLAWKMRFPKHQSLPEMYQMMLAPCATVLNQYFEADILKATFASDGVIGAMGSPYSQGSSYILLHHVMGEIDGKNQWYIVKGGMGSVTKYLAKLATERGVQIRTNSEIEEIITSGSKVRGVRLSDGSVIEAPIIISNATHHVTFNKLIKDPKAIPEQFKTGLKNVNYEGSACKINLVIKDIPQFNCLSEINDKAKSTKSMEEKISLYLPYLQGTAHINSESMLAIHQAYVEALNGQVCKRPMIEMVIPSVLDASLNKNNDGNLICSLFVQYAPSKLQNGKEWDEESRQQFIKNTFSTIEEYAPGFSKLVLHYEALFPPDLERIFNLTGGNIFHGALSLNNQYFSRPMPNYANYNTPFKNLFMCGSGNHPGGGVMGSPGRLCAQRVVSSFKRGSI